MNKGFTLVELLAVIIILAISSLIVIPLTLNIVNKSKKESEVINEKIYLNAVKQAVTQKNLTTPFKPKSCFITSDGNILCKENKTKVELEIKSKGTKPCNGKIEFNEEGVITSKTLKFICETPSFKDDDWETIISNVEVGNIDSYNVGDEKTIELTGDVSGKYKVRIANKETPEECSNPEFSETACGFVVEFVDIIVKHKMNTGISNAGGWQDSEMREYVNNEIYNSLPQELKDGIISTTVISGHESGKDANYTTTDNLYLLSTKEVWGANVGGYDSATKETRQLDYYEKKGVNSLNYLKTIKNFEESATAWWLRSAVSNYTISFYTVTRNGDWYGRESNNNDIGVSPAFRIG